MASGVTFSLGLARPPSPPNHGDATAARLSKTGNKRSHSALGDDSDDDATPAKQAVTHFNEKGAFNSAAKPTKEKAPLVIQGQANRDWRDASKAAQAQRRARYGLPAQGAEADAKSREEELKRLEDAGKPTFGLNIMAKGPEDEAVAKEAATDAGSQQPEQSQAGDLSEEPKKPRTDDERAMDALLGIKHHTDLTIPAATEEEAFQRDYKDAPPMASLEQYAAVPVEEFGAALLRGMGWKEGHGIGNQSGTKIQKVKVPERRPALLGIGAKEDAAIKEELGAWGRGSKKGRPEQMYNPVIMRNKKTGEEVTEEEVKAKLEDQQMRDKDAELDATKRRPDERDYHRTEERRRKDAYSKDDYRRRDDYGKEKRRSRDDYGAEERRKRDDYSKDDRRKKDDYNRDDYSRDERQRRDEYSDEEYERRRREKRRQREREHDGRDRDSHRSSDTHRRHNDRRRH